MSEPPDSDFATRTKRALDDLAAVKNGETLDATFRGLGPRRFGWPMVLGLALVAATLAALVTWNKMSSPDDASSTPAAFDGGLRKDGEAWTEGLVGAPASDPSIKRDARGRISEIAVDGAADGERLIFRAGRLLRIEHWRGGHLDGIVVDLDGSGRVVRVETWLAGERVGPSVELDPELRPSIQASPSLPGPHLPESRP